MSLRLRLSLIITILFMLALCTGIGFQLTKATQRVSLEVDSAAVLTSQLLQVLLNKLSAEQAVDAGSELVAAIAAVASRDLDIVILEPGVLAPAREQVAVPEVPDWFVWLVQPPLMQYVFIIPGTAGQRLLLQTNPAAEIREVWGETLNFTLVLLLVLVVINSLLYFTVGRWFAPMRALAEGLKDAEHGHFTAQLEPASLPELQVLTARFNQLTRTLSASRADNDRLRQKALQIQEQEQRHLARELHDELGQSITAIKSIAYSLGEHTRESDPVLWQGANTISAISTEVGQRLRTLMGRLRPVVLDELGLVPALQGMVDEWNGIHREIFCSLHCVGDFSALDESRQSHLYRIVQEALTNAARHSEAATITVKLGHDATGYTLLIEDDGKGFDPVLTPRGMGLTGFKERAQALGGQYELVSQPGAGFRLTLGFTQETEHADH